MAETSAGGCVRKAATSRASTRPCASLSSASSAASGSAPASTRRSASATGISAIDLFLCLKAPGLAAALFEQSNTLDAHSALNGFDHVVDGETGHGHGGERLHLDSSLAGN